MKKFFMLLAIALPMVFTTACGDDEDDPTTPINFTVSELAVHTGDAETLTVDSKNPGVLTWASSDAFVATVSQNGEVRGQHVGTATITATNAEGRKASAKVTVLAENDNFKVPVIVWGLNANQVKSEMAANYPGTFYMEEDSETTPDADGFTTAKFMTGSTTPGYSYVFADKKLINSTLTLTIDQDEDGNFDEFLRERYKEYGDKDNETYFMNADELSKATMKILYVVDFSDKNNPISYAIWQENEDYKGSRAAVADFNHAAAVEKARKVARSF